MIHNPDQGPQPYKNPKEGEEEEVPDWDQTKDGDGAEAGQLPTKPQNY